MLDLPRKEKYKNIRDTAPFSKFTFVVCSVAKTKQSHPTPIYSCSLERKKFKHFVLNKYFCLVLGLLKSKISKKSTEGPQSYHLAGLAQPGLIG